jgi:alkylhydroperoxidase family enzyme
MSHIPFSDNGASPFERLLGYTPSILEHWGLLESAFFQSKTFDAYFLEQLRRALAFDNVCQYCMAKAGLPDQNIQDTRLTEAMRLANKLAIDHHSIDASEISRLKQFFSDQEISELIAFCCFISASQRFGAVLGLQSAETYTKKI